jgi:hypothetical protein
MLPPIYTILSSNTAVAAIAADRIYPHGEAPQNVERPYVTWFLVSGLPENELDGLPDVDRCAVQIDCWADDGTGAVQLASAVRDAIEPHAHVTNIALNGKEPETGLYRFAIQTDYWLSR